MLNLVVFLSCAGVHAEVFEFAVIADAGDWNPMSREVRDSIGATPIRRLVLPGDNTYSEFLGRRGYQNAWRNWYDQGFLTEVVAIGNHTSSYETEVRFFGMPGEHYAKIYNDTLGWPQVRFVVLNSDNEDSVPQQRDFLERSLGEAQEPFVFVVYHHPSYNTGGQHQWEQKRAFQLSVRPLLQKFSKKITAVLVGHDHIAATYQWGGVLAVVSGATHETRRSRPVDFTDARDGVAVSTLYMFPSQDNSGYWLRLKLDSQTRRSELSFIRAKTREVTWTRNGIAPADNLSRLKFPSPYQASAPACMAVAL